MAEWKSSRVRKCEYDDRKAVRNKRERERKRSEQWDEWPMNDHRRELRM